MDRSVCDFIAGGERYYQFLFLDEKYGGVCFEVDTLGLLNDLEAFDSDVFLVG